MPSPYHEDKTSFKTAPAAVTSAGGQDSDDSHLIGSGDGPGPTIKNGHALPAQQTVKVQVRSDDFIPVRVKTNNFHSSGDSI
jgi:hypothetical protein